MWYQKVMIGILIFPWSLIFVMVAGAFRLRQARKARVLVLSPSPVETAPILPLSLPEPVLCADRQVLCSSS
jgi:hypothetical protein